MVAWSAVCQVLLQAASLNTEKTLGTRLPNPSFSLYSYVEISGKYLLNTGLKVPPLVRSPTETSPSRRSQLPHFVHVLSSISVPSAPVSNLQQPVDVLCCESIPPSLLVLITWQTLLLSVYLDCGNSAVCNIPCIHNLEGPKFTYCIKLSSLYYSQLHCAVCTHN